MSGKKEGAVTPLADCFIFSLTDCLVTDVNITYTAESIINGEQAIKSTWTMYTYYFSMDDKNGIK